MKERMVTRTITVSCVNATCFDTENNCMVETHYQLSGSWDSTKALAEIRKKYETDTLKVAAVTVTENVALYGMTESKFIENADILPARSIE